MASTAAAHMMRQADVVKATLTDSGKAFSELWVSRQKLEDLYKKMLLLDLEYALDKKVEQELWNHAFKNQINTLQAQAKERQNTKKTEAQASLNLFLEMASGFYLQFLQMICSTFKLDLPFRRRSAAFGVMRENIGHKNIVTPKKSSCLYICCHCLVHLGDIARYRQQTEQAQTYYRHAANLSPNNGQPYNQLAILEASRGDKLSTVFYYVRSLAVRHPFPVAATNLEKFYSKLIKDTRSDFDSPNLSVSEIVTAFLQFQALLHMSTGLDRASSLKSKITTGLGTHIRSQTVSAAHLTGMVAISIFALHRCRADTIDGTQVLKKMMAAEEERCLQIHLSFSAKLLEVMLQHTPKEDNKARDFLTLSAIKVLLDWLGLNKDVLQRREFNNTSIWQDLCKLLNTLQWLLNDSNKAADLQKYEDTPLPEDIDLRCFQPLEPSHSEFNFTKVMPEDLSAACERDLRCQRLVAHGKRIAQDLPKLKLLVFQSTKSIRTQFSTQKAPQTSPEGQGTVTPVKSHRQNVAMQTILKKQMQKRKEQEQGTISPLSVISEEGRSTVTDQPPGISVIESVVIPAATSDAGQQKGPGGGGGSGRQAGVLNIHHRGGNQKNLPPRLSAKVGHTQNSNLSPRLQKKQAQARGGGAGSSGQSQSRTVTEDSDSRQAVESTSASSFSEQESYPSLSADNYPALVNQRVNASLIPTDTQHHTSQQQPQSSSGTTGFMSGPSWGGLNLGRDNPTAVKSASMASGLSPIPPRIPMPGAPSTGVDSIPGPARSPQPAQAMRSPFCGTEPAGSGINPSMAIPDLDSSTMHGIAGLSFPNTTLSPEFLSAIRSASQLVQQQQQQLQQQHQQQMFHGLQQHQQLSGESKAQNLSKQQQQQLQQQQKQFQQPDGPYSHNQQMNRMYSQQQHHLQQSEQQQQQHNQRSHSAMFQPQPSLHPGTTTAPHRPQSGATPSQAQSALMSVQAMKMGVPQTGLSGMGLGPHQSGMDSRGRGSAGATDVHARQGYQPVPGDTAAAVLSGKQPVGFIPPSGVPNAKSQMSAAGTTSFPMSVMTGGVSGRGSQVQPAFMGGQSQGSHRKVEPQQQQQQQLMEHQSHQQKAKGAPAKPYQSGLLYQNIPLPGSAGSAGDGGREWGGSGGSGGRGGAGGGGPSSSAGGLSGLFGSQGQQSGMSHQQYNRGIQSANVAALHNARLSASFQGHAAGTPKPEQQANLVAAFLSQQQQAQSTQSRQPLPSQLGPGPGPGAAQQALIPSVMDPPFLQGSGEYTLFSNNSNSAWPTSLAVKTTPSQPGKSRQAKGSDPASGGVASSLVSTGMQMPPALMSVQTEPGVGLQGLWSSSTGPSPLERLLEQQRNQRQMDG